MRRFGLIVTGMLLLIAARGVWAAEITDTAGRRLNVPIPAERVICSGPGCLRLLVYLQAQDQVVAVDDIEKKRPQFDARPYSLANPQFRSLPMFGEFRGFDNPELIMTLNPAPEVIFKTSPNLGHDPHKLQQKTGIPVIILDYGDLEHKRQILYQSLRIMGRVTGKQQRAEDVIGYFEKTISDLAARTQDIPPGDRKSCFVGGIALRGPHGFRSTEPGYPPFGFVNALNVAQDPDTAGKSSGAAGVAKEKIVEWDPDILFLDLSTLQMGAKAGGLFELRNDPAYRTLSAVQKGEVYGLLPYSWYTQNFGSILANAYFIGKLLYPSRFTDVEPALRADEIYSFLVGKPVFQVMEQEFQNLVYRKIPLN
jgi:iron complex transport system substrate-binding protein